MYWNYRIQASSGKSKVANKIYFNEKCDLLKYGFHVQEFDEFCKNYNPKFFKEYLERYFDK